eukprot:TRINITY_DN11355_c0_g1_i1.p1 TRINITY_DN11355_c0_g1~~TRINITY_DN11355_c0_g1_i1.p1  ORF type:complete len:124 (+),score=9.01 TRINITY_DN11355_c0_g1_i1:36-407(+)
MNSGRVMRKRAKKKSKKRRTRKERAKKRGKPSHYKGVVTYLKYEYPTKRYGLRKGVMVETFNGKKLSAFVPFDGGLQYVSADDIVLVEHYHRSNLPRYKYRVIKVAYVSLSAIWKGIKDKPRP